MSKKITTFMEVVENSNEYFPVLDERSSYTVRGWHETGMFDIPFGKYQRKAMEFAKKKRAEGYNVQVVVEYRTVVEIVDVNETEGCYYEEDEC